MPNNPKFQALQAKWYKKLKDSGFEDIEDTSSPRQLLKRWTSEIYNRQTHNTLTDRQNFYISCTQLLETAEWPNPVEKKIWAMFCEGMSCRQMHPILNRNQRSRKKRISHKRISQTLTRLKARLLCR